MSVQAVCDRCGITMGAVTEKDSRDVEVYLGDADEPYFVAEDLCPECMEEIRASIDAVIAPKTPSRDDVAQPKARFDDFGSTYYAEIKPHRSEAYTARQEVSDERA